MYYSFMLITNKGHRKNSEYIEYIKACADGGITSVQLREKSLSYDALCFFGEELRTALEPYNIPLIINDSVDLACALGSNYIHVGNNDDSCEIIHQRIKNANIGLSIESMSDIERANTYNVSYVAASAVFPSTTKSNLRTLWGLDGVQLLSNISTHPLIAIGGITWENVEDVLAYGAQGIAVISALHDAKNPYAMAQEIRAVLDSYIVL